MRERALFLYQADGIGRDTLLAACKAETLGGRRLDGDTVGIAAYDGGKAVAHGVDMRTELRSLGTHCRVDIAQMVTLLCEEGNRVT